MKVKKKQLKKTISRAAKKPAVLRYQTPKTKKILDEAVPLDLLNTFRLKQKKPIIKSKEDNGLSPFIISFVPERIEAVAESTSLRLDFVAPEHELSHGPQAADEFLLTHEELTPQLQEEEFTRRQLIVKPNISFSPASALSSIREAIQNFKNKKEIYEPLAEKVNLSALSHDSPFPRGEGMEERIAVPFDLPEAEEDENEEAEIITWEEIISSVAAAPPLASSEKERIPFSFLKQSFRQLHLHLPAMSGVQRAITVFALLSFAFVLPLHAMETISDLRQAKNNLAATGSEAVFKLNKAVSLIATNTVSAANSFEAVEKDFNTARSTINNLNATASLLLSLLPSTRTVYKSSANLTAGGEELARAGEKISRGLTALQTDGLDATGKLSILTQTLETAIPLLASAEAYLARIDPAVIPADYQSQLAELQALLPNLLISTKKMVKYSDTLSALLGAEGKKRYLLLFQNNTELRPTGGFIGSFAVLDVARGEITNLEVPEGGSYDLRGSQKKNIAAPLPLQLLSARWEFQDANWFPDFPTSARQALEFYYDAGWPTVDGVIAVNSTFVASLLSLLGPIEMNEYDKTIDSENFLFEIQKMVEYDYASYGDALPKAFIGELAERLLARLKNLEAFALIGIFDAAQKGLSQKDIQLYFPDEKLQKKARQFKWTGEIEQMDGDYLMVVDTNLGGGKTDLIIEEEVNLQAAVQDDGRIINTVTVTRTHHGVSGALFTGVNNVDYLRLYVPKGSRLLSASGFTVPDISLFEKPENSWDNDPDILYSEESAKVDAASGTITSEEAGKTVFGNWLQVKPGNSATVVFVYELPFKIDLDDSGPLKAVADKIGWRGLKPYSLYLQKQSGQLNRVTTVGLVLPKQIELKEAATETSFDNTTDHLFNVALREK